MYDKQKGATRLLACSRYINLHQLCIVSSSRNGVATYIPVRPCLPCHSWRAHSNFCVHYFLIHLVDNLFLVIHHLMALHRYLLCLSQGLHL